MNHGPACLCDACIDPKNARDRVLRRRRHAERVWVKNRAREGGGYWHHPNPGQGGHGSHHAYNSYGCRCTVCIEAQRNRNWDAKRRPGSRVGRYPYDPLPNWHVQEMRGSRRLSESNVAADYQAGWTQRQLADREGCSQAAVSAYLREQGVTMRKPGPRPKPKS